MAEKDAEVNASKTDEIDQVEANHVAKNTPEGEQLPETSGWLLKRTRISHKWQRQWFILKKNELHYGETEGNAVKQINLEEAEIAESDMDQKSFAFKIKPKDSSRTYYICAEDETSQNYWMQAICFAKAAGKNGDASQACSIQ